MIGEDLDTRERMDLAGVAGMPGYQVILDIMESACQIAETRHFQTMRPDKADREKIIASLGMCIAQREFFETVQKKITYEVELARAPKPQVMNEEDLEIREITEPFQ